MKLNLILLLLSLPMLASAQKPQVSNFTARVEGRELVIEYDLDRPTPQIVKFTYNPKYDPKVKSKYHGVAFPVIPDKGDDPATAGHHRVVYRVLDAQNLDVWRAENCAFGIGIANPISLADKFYPGQSTSRPKQTFSADWLPAHWRSMGFREKMTLDQLISLLEGLGFHIDEVYKSKEGTYSVTAACKDLDLYIYEWYNDKKKKQTDADPREWNYKLEYNPYTVKYEYTFSSPQDYVVYSNPSFAEYTNAELRTATDGYTYYYISKDGKHFGIADRKMNEIIAPDKYTHIEYTGGYFKGQSYDPSIKKSRYSLIDLAGKVIIPDNPGDIVVLGDEAPIKVYKGEKCALFSRDGKQLTDFKYYFPVNCLGEDGLIAYLIGDKDLGFMDYEGNIVLTTKYHSVNQSFNNGYAVGYVDKDSKKAVAFDRQGKPVVPDNLLNNINKGWVIYMSTKNLPKGIIAVYQNRFEKVKVGKDENVRKIDEDHFLYNVATGQTWRIRRGDVVNSPYDADNAYSHRFEQAGNYIVCYAKGKLFTLDPSMKNSKTERERIVAVIGTDMNSLLPYRKNYDYIRTKVIDNRYLPYEYIGDLNRTNYTHEVKTGTYDLYNGQKISDYRFVAVGDDAVYVPYTKTRGQLCNLMLEPLVPFESGDVYWKDASQKDGYDLYDIHNVNIEVYKDKNGDLHYLPEHAPEALQSTLELDSLKAPNKIYAAHDGTVFITLKDAKALRNNIANYISPRPSRKPLKSVTSEILSLAKQGIPYYNYFVYSETGLTSYLDRAVDLGYSWAMGVKGYPMLGTPDSIRGKELMQRAAEGGNPAVRAYYALQASKAGRYEEAYEQFKDLDYIDSRYEAGMAALARAYELYESEGAESGYEEWVERAADCDVALAEKWAATIAKDKGDAPRCAALYAKAADRDDVEAAYAAALEYQALGELALYEKYMEMAAKAKLADADVLLGRYYLKGQPGAEPDTEKAFTWLNQARVRGIKEVANDLKSIALPLANGALADRKYTQSARYARSYVAVDSLNPEAYETLGMAYYGNGEYGLAIDAFNRQLKLDPKNMACVDNIERATSKYSAEQAAKQRKEKIDSYRKQAEEAMKRGDYTTAIENCESAAALDGTLAWPYSTIARAYYFMRDYDAGIWYSQRALEIDPSDYDGKYYLAQCQSQLQAQHNAQVAAQQQVDKWQAIANLCSSTQQLFNAIGNATRSSAPRRNNAAAQSRPVQRNTVTSTPSTSKPKSSFADNWEEKKCTYCGGDGISPECKYAPRFAHEDEIFCRKCGRFDHRHTHLSCPACNGKGTVKRRKR